MKNQELAHIFAELDESIGKYCSERRNQIPQFVGHHFSFNETVQIQKKHFWADLWIYPLNALWSVPHFTIKRILKGLDKIGWTAAYSILEFIPSGIKTHHQREVEGWMKKEWLQLESGSRNEGLKINDDDLKIIQAEVNDYLSGQALIADLAGTLGVFLVSWMVFGSRTFDFLGLGNLLAGRFAQNQASSHFFFGEAIGSKFYGFFPPEPSLFQQFLGFLLVAFILTTFGLVANVVADPLRKQLGLHHRRFNHLIDQLEERLFIVMKKSARKNHIH